jgi:hypothetical protein
MNNGQTARRGLKLKIGREPLEVSKLPCAVFFW